MVRKPATDRCRLGSRRDPPAPRCPAGFFYGIETHRQLMVRDGSATLVSHCEILDYPAFKVRGVMHNVGRDFLSIDLLKKQVELMSRYKYNVFHWHLTEHHAWRLESKIYPELQSSKAFQRFPGEYYTQREFVDFVKFCRARHITVIPEFDTPGHSKSPSTRHSCSGETMLHPSFPPCAAERLPRPSGWKSASDCAWIRNPSRFYPICLICPGIPPAIAD